MLSFRRRRRNDCTSLPNAVLQAKRTPFGTFGGKLKGMSAIDLAVHASKAAIAAANVRRWQGVRVPIAAAVRR